MKKASQKCGLHCANCSISFENSEICLELEIHREKNIEGKQGRILTSSVTTVSVQDALRCIYKFDLFKNFEPPPLPLPPLLLDTMVSPDLDHQQNFQPVEPLVGDDKVIGVCQNCAKLLTIMYEAYDQFNEVRSPGSFVDWNVRKMDLMSRQIENEQSQPKIKDVHVETNKRRISARMAAAAAKKRNDTKTNDSVTSDDDPSNSKSRRLTIGYRKKMTDEDNLDGKLPIKIRIKKLPLEPGSLSENFDEMVTEVKTDKLDFDPPIKKSHRISTMADEAGRNHTNGKKIMPNSLAVITTRRCPICPGSAKKRIHYATTKEFYRHLYGHMKEKAPPKLKQTDVWPCPLCPRKISNKSNLYMHLRIHANYLQYKCQFPGCQQAFISRCYLITHSKIHEGQQGPPSESNIDDDHQKVKESGKNFEKNEQPAVKTVEASPVNDPKMKKNHHECPTCKQECKNNFRLSIHIRRHHTKSRPFTCDLCQRSFVVGSDLSQHKRTKLHQGMLEKMQNHRQMAEKGPKMAETGEEIKENDFDNQKLMTMDTEMSPENVASNQTEIVAEIKKESAKNVASVNETMVVMETKMMEKNLFNETPVPMKMKPLEKNLTPEMLVAMGMKALEKTLANVTMAAMKMRALKQNLNTKLIISREKTSAKRKLVKKPVVVMETKSPEKKLASQTTVVMEPKSPVKNVAVESKVVMEMKPVENNREILSAHKNPVVILTPILLPMMKNDENPIGQQNEGKPALSPVTVAAAEPSKMKKDVGDLKKFKCKICKQICDNLKALTSHHRFYHRKWNKRVPCGMCGVSCSSFTKMEHHMQTLHGEDTTPELMRRDSTEVEEVCSGVGDFGCGQNGATNYDQAENTKNDEEDIEETADMVKIIHCPFCLASFTKKRDMELHMAEGHDD